MLSTALFCADSENDIVRAIADFNKMAHDTCDQARDIVTDNDANYPPYFLSPKNIDPKFPDHSPNQKDQSPFKWISPELTEENWDKSFRRLENNDAQLDIMDAVDLNQDRILGIIGVDNPVDFRKFIKNIYSIDIREFAKTVDKNGTDLVPPLEIISVKFRLMVTSVGGDDEYYIWETQRGTWVVTRQKLGKARAKFRYILSYFSDDLKLFTSILTIFTDQVDKMVFREYLAPW